MRPATSPAFDFLVSSHLAGVSGGLAAIPVWELLRGRPACFAGPIGRMKQAEHARATGLSIPVQGHGFADAG